MSLRRLRVLIRHLPGDSYLMKLVRARRRTAGIIDDGRIEDAPQDVWDQTQWMLVHLFDEVQALRYAYALTHRDPKKPKPQPPPPYRRPGMPTTRRQTLNAWFGAVGLTPAKATGTT